MSDYCKIKKKEGEGYYYIRRNICWGCGKELSNRESYDMKHHCSSCTETDSNEYIESLGELLEVY